MADTRSATDEMVGSPDTTPISPGAKGKASPSGSTTTSSWWGSWIDTARSKSASVLEAVKNDLTELSTVVKSEATSASEALGRTLSLGEPDSTVGAMKKSFSSFLGQVTEALVPSLEDDEETEAILITADGTVTLTGFHKHLAELQARDDTYLDEPADELREKYKRWMEVVEQEQFTEPRLGKHLASSTILNDKYVTLVPNRVAHMEFWKRYLFKKALLEDAIANADMAERKAKAAAASAETVAPSKTIVQTAQPRRTIEEEEEPAEEEGQYPAADDIAWAEVPEFDATNIELSEEEQARLLEEYEQEIREREKSVSGSVGRLELVDESLLVQSDIEGTPQKTTPATSVSKPQKKDANAKGPQPKVGGKPEAANSNQQPTASKANTQKQQQQQKHQQGNKSSGGATGKSVNKSAPASGKKGSPAGQPSGGAKKDQLKIDKNHFTKEAEASSSNSDESWEKEFELE
ncbi:BSD domain-containing protein 1-A-like [Anopheles bellator]|uniref:BSD domain-containing protein 1-A-like n=1 Tax=Anopheles bellator TaxID=139047 RepID=UPI00264985F4|nr:BSD domain-containing protein 1-A-like [Anopheles bellator]